MTCFRPILLVALAVSLPTAIAAQSLNIDLDIGGGPPEVGNGAPSSTFGGAASSPGFWNRVDAGGPVVSTVLADLSGTSTSARLIATGATGSRAGYHNSANTGDYALLLNDVAIINHVAYHFSGLQPGDYLVYTYAVDPTGLLITTQVTIAGAATPNQYVTGPIPGNQFVLGVTHCVHDITIAGDSFEIDIGTTSNFTQCNGFQIVAVPEPATLYVSLIGIVTLVKRRERAM